MRTVNRLGVVAATGTLLFGIGCNAILGIDEGHLVSDDSGTGSGAGGKKPGSGGDTSSDGSAAGGEGNGAGGSSAGGGKGTGGKGSGGTTTDGGVDGGSGAPGAGGGGGTAPTGVAGEVACASQSCRISSNQACCVGTTDGSDAHCSTSCDTSKQTRFACDGAEDCGTGQRCCYPIGATTATCSASCTGRVFCGKDADCAPGQRCAPGSGALKTVSVCADVPKAKSLFCDGAVCVVGQACCYDKTAKTAKCTAGTACPTNNIRYACDGADDCAAGEKCCPKSTGLGVFTGTACAASCDAGKLENTCGGSNGCAAGFQCCLGGNSGAQCAALCAGAQQVCGTDADCAENGGECALETDATLGKEAGRSVCTVAAPSR